LELAGARFTPTKRPNVARLFAGMPQADRFADTLDAGGGRSQAIDVSLSKERIQVQSIRSAQLWPKRTLPDLNLNVWDRPNTEFQ
jgi:hypothetical protein